MATLFNDAPAAGLPLPRIDYQENVDLIEDSLFDLGPFVLSGLGLSIGTGLSVDVATGVASIGGRLTVGTGFAVAVTDATTNHIFLLKDGSGVSNTTGTAPANSLKLGTAVAAGGVVTSVDQTWSSGRQMKVSPATAMTWTADQTLADGTDFILGTSTGSKIGTGTTQKLGFFNATPVVQPATNVDIRTALVNLGLIAGGANPLNLNGGDLTADDVLMSGSFRGSGTPVGEFPSTVTPATDADVTLSTAEMESGLLRIATGAWTAGHNVIVPSSKAGMRYWIHNNTAFTATIKTSGGTGAAVAAGKTAFVYSFGGVNFTLGPSN